MRTLDSLQGGDISKTSYGNLVFIFKINLKYAFAKIAYQSSNHLHDEVLMLKIIISRW